ncbi:winged helix-turn-helix domain-containing protein [Serratia fonticola]|uniref:winged helix-turn-helix domain-containing protein n=1 Tax=Serratia fonticola TaxID=47917 RepID=UPI0016487C9D|nr:helix-turn-helix domain-containing protein [Serratia fonticola]MBC3231820.1 winged helix-turn-helix domain-containing protein [Serratia fonticola]
MENNLFGFLIDNDIQLDIPHKRLIRISTISSGKMGKAVLFGSIELSEVTLRLLVFILQHEKGERLSKDEIFKYVWEDANLSSSNQRLWQAINELRLKLSSLGLPHDFILNTRGAGYSLNSSDVTPLFYKNFN